MTISEESTRSVLKTVGKLCKLMKALTGRKSENIFYFFKYSLNISLRPFNMVWEISMSK